MKSSVFVFVPYHEVKFLREYLDAVVEPHRMDALYRSGRFDWIISDDERFGDAVADRALPGALREVYGGAVCDLADLGEDDIPAAVVTFDGIWHDLDDFGYRLIDEDSEDNRRALAAWNRHFRRLVDAQEACFVLAMISHC